MLTLAFYKGRGATRLDRFVDWAIRAATGGIYSHVELIAGPAELGETAVCLSSSGRDGEVREKHITLRPESWDLVTLNIDPKSPEGFIRARLGKKYDFRGIVLSHFFAFGGHDSDRWFCSELCAAAIGIPSPHKVSPARLYELVMWRGRGR